MFTKLAKFRRLGPRHGVPHWLEAAHSNDNPRGRRRPTGQCRCPQPVLACHWIFVDDGRLECHWAVESFDETSAGVHMPHRFQRKQLATRVLALVLVTSLFCIAIFAAIYRGAQ